jgi:hypothetical protein
MKENVDGIAYDDPSYTSKDRSINAIKSCHELFVVSAMLM